MPNLSEKISKNLIAAQKEKDENKVSTLRMLQSSLKNEEIEKKKREGLSDEEIGQVVKREVKKRKDSIQSYMEGGRDDLVKKEEEEIKVLAEYMPKELSEEEVLKVVEKVINETGAESSKDLGMVMGLVMKELKGKASGDVVNKIVKEKLP
jgi:uncharacterized protein YqeY